MTGDASASARAPLRSVDFATKSRCSWRSVEADGGRWLFCGEDNALTRENSVFPKIYTIFEGTSEIQRLVIARAISGMHID